ncbi:hypothetical protein [Paracoccus niistensis]|uniref:Uncharacterized protein n=1 Tax=Paracoccus niistensis TaxID=632935 RepID=A0ABV6HZB6_9RHOB
MQEHQGAQESALQTSVKVELAELEQLSLKGETCSIHAAWQRQAGIVLHMEHSVAFQTCERKMQLRPQEGLGQRAVMPFATMCTQVQLAARQSAGRCSGCRMNT